MTQPDSSGAYSMAEEAVQAGAGQNSRLTVTEVAQRLGISVKTILRWEKAGKIRRARRDWRGWRVYAPEDLEQIKGFFQTVY